MRRERKGFTLIEVLVVVAIIVMLAGGAAIAVRSYYRGSQIDMTKAKIEQVRSGIDTFHLKLNRLPSSDKGLRELVEVPDEEKEVEAWKQYGPFLKDGKIPTDAWGRDLQYELAESESGPSYRVYSYGPDGIEGTDDDIPTKEK